MKLISYLLQPLKILFFLLLILSLIYFRNVIFLPNITQNVDAAQAYLEKRLDISIPVYINKNITEPVVNKQAELTETSSDLCGNSDVVEADIKADAISAAVSVDTVITEDVIADLAAAEIISPSIDTKPSQEITVTEVIDNSGDALAELDLLTQLSATVNALNNKVDKLFDEVKVSVDATLNSPDNTQETVNIEGTKPSVDEVVKQNNAKNVHLTEEVKQMFYMARQSYWMGNPIAAEKIYLKLMNIEDDNPDVYGELGNVYYTQGKWNEAGKAYYEAAIRLLDLDRNNQVDYLLRVIQGLDSDSAEKLKQKMSS